MRAKPTFMDAIVTFSIKVLNPSSVPAARVLSSAYLGFFSTRPKILNPISVLSSQAYDLT